MDSLGALIAANTTAIAGKYGPSDTAYNISTKAYRQKGVDSLNALIAANTTAIAGKYGPSDTAYTLSTMAYRQKGVDSLNALIVANTTAIAGKIGLSNLSASSPLVYNNSTGVFSIQQANTSQSGYLSSTDWNTFNSKGGTATLTLGKGLTGGSYNPNSAATAGLDTSKNYAWLSTQDFKTSIILDSGNTGFYSYNTLDSLVNFRRMQATWSSNDFIISNTSNGIAANGNLILQNAGTSPISKITIGTINSSGIELKRDNTSLIGSVVSVNSSGLTSSTGEQSLLSTIGTVSQSGTASINAAKFGLYEASTGSGAHYLWNAGLYSAANGGGTFTQKGFLDDAGNFGAINKSTFGSLTAATNTVTINDSTGNGLATWLSAVSSANAKKGLLQWQNGNLTLGTYFSGSASSPSLQIGLSTSNGGSLLTGGARLFQINNGMGYFDPNTGSSTSGVFNFSSSPTGVGFLSVIQGSASSSSTTQYWNGTFLTAKQSSTGGYRVNSAIVYDSLNGTGPADLFFGGTSTSSGPGATISQKFGVDHNGNGLFLGYVGVGSVSSNNASAALQVTSTTQGFRPPTMTTTQQNAITSPATGLQVYNTTNDNPSYYAASIGGTAGWAGYQPITKVAAAATTGTVTATLNNVSVWTVTPTGAITFNASGGVAGQEATLVVTTSGTTAYTITFGTNFKTTGTLNTGTVSGKVFTVRFVYDGTNWNENGRTTAM